ncbi:unnamed protein product [Effrenium voratum]|nr:unnamed protein product [Effrenium voratum]
MLVTSLAGKLQCRLLVAKRPCVVSFASGSRASSVQGAFWHGVSFVALAELRWFTIMLGCRSMPHTSRRVRKSDGLGGIVCIGTIFDFGSPDVEGNLRFRRPCQAILAGCKTGYWEQEKDNPAPPATICEAVERSVSRNFRGFAPLPQTSESLGKEPTTTS